MLVNTNIYVMLYPDIVIPGLPLLSPPALDVPRYPGSLTPADARSLVNALQCHYAVVRKAIQCALAEYDQDTP